MVTDDGDYERHGRRDHERPRTRADPTPTREEPRVAGSIPALGTPHGRYGRLRAGNSPTSNAPAKHARPRYRRLISPRVSSPNAPIANNTTAAISKIARAPIDPSFLTGRIGCPPDDRVSSRDAPVSVGN